MQIKTALDIALEGEKADIAKPLKGFPSSIFEIAMQYQSNAYRSVYAVKLGHGYLGYSCFSKKIEDWH